MSANPPIKLVRSELSFRYETCGQHEALYAMTKRLVFPIGFIWYDHPLLQHLGIGYIFVHEQFRRQGLGTLMLEKLQDWYPGETICTQQGNEHSTPWLQARRFVKEPAGWFLRPPTIEPCPMI